uniref:Pkinase-domain-containing protein n=1 Tax=Mycena chlorophos TaxID=658473 RepID=A0ABQ0L2A4_MYCCL|nr:Pkinase-domain-containing protein [Mycena chlorophos]
MSDPSVGSSPPEQIRDAKHTAIPDRDPQLASDNHLASEPHPGMENPGALKETAVEASTGQVAEGVAMETTTSEAQEPAAGETVEGVSESREESAVTAPEKDSVTQQPSDDSPSELISESAPSATTEGDPFADPAAEAGAEGEEDADEEEEEDEDEVEQEQELNSEDEREEALYWHDQIIAELFRACRASSPLKSSEYKYLSTLPGVDRMGNGRHTARATRTGEVVLLRVTPLPCPVERFAGQRLINELFLMRDMRPSPNVVGFYDLYLATEKKERGEEAEDEDSDEDEDEFRGLSEVWLVQQYMAEGASLSELIAYNNGPGAFKEEWVARICLEAAKGLAHLHDQLIIHRDIRSESLLVDPRGRVKITNFAYAVQLPTAQAKRRTMVSTLALPARSPYTPDKTHWTPPEVIRRREYAIEVDVWSLGVTIMEMLDGRPPHSGNAPLRVLFLILISGTPKLEIANADELSAELKDFLAQCVEVDVEKRATAAQLVEHSFLKRVCEPADLAALFEYRTREAPDSDDEQEAEAESSRAGEESQPAVDEAAEELVVPVFGATSARKRGAKDGDEVEDVAAVTTAVVGAEAVVEADGAAAAAPEKEETSEPSGKEVLVGQED